MGCIVEFANFSRQLDSQSLEWRHLNVMASQITHNYVYSTVSSAKQQKSEHHITGRLWEESIDDRWFPS